MARHKEADEVIPKDVFDIGALVYPGDRKRPSKIENLATSSSDELSDPPINQVVSRNETESDSNDDDDVVPASYPPEASTSVQVPATAPASTIRSTLRINRKHTKRFESQHVRDVAAAQLKEQRKKDREAKANRTGTGRTKAAEALAQTSQLLDGIELAFRSSQ
jgi:hypothetical protein